MEKSEKSMTEVEMELNLKYDWSKLLLGDGGEAAALENVTGPGLKGLTNMGATCYLNSVMQRTCSNIVFFLSLAIP